MSKFDREDREQHDSFGMIGWSRQHSTGTRLFGSDLNHSNLISIRVHQAVRERSLSKSWYFSDKLVTEVILSQHQFSEFLCTPNMGDGVPCTIRSTQMERNIEYRDDLETEGDLHKKEFQEQMGTIKHKGKAVRHRLLEMQQGKTIKKGDFKELADMVDNLVMEMVSNVPFVEESFRKSMDKTVAAGKAEIEAYVQHKVTSAGLTALGAEPPTLIENDDD
jgi:hypothetical protein